MCTTTSSWLPSVPQQALQLTSVGASYRKPSWPYLLCSILSFIHLRNECFPNPSYAAPTAGFCFTQVPLSRGLCLWPLSKVLWDLHHSSQSGHGWDGGASDSCARGPRGPDITFTFWTCMELSPFLIFASEVWEDMCVFLK